MWFNFKQFAFWVGIYAFITQYEPYSLDLWHSYIILTPL